MNSTISRGVRKSSKPRNRRGNGAVELRTTIASTPIVILAPTVTPSTTPSSTANANTAAANRNGTSTVIRRRTCSGRSRATTTNPTRMAARAPNASQAPGGSDTETTTSPIRPTILTRGSSRCTGESPAATASTSPPGWCPPPVTLPHPREGAIRRAPPAAQQQDDARAEREAKEDPDQPGEPRHPVVERGSRLDVEHGGALLLGQAFLDRRPVRLVLARAVDDRALQRVRGTRGEVGDHHPDQQRYGEADEDERDDGPAPLRGHYATSSWLVVGTCTGNLSRLASRSGREDMTAAMTLTEIAPSRIPTAMWTPIM